MELGREDVQHCYLHSPIASGSKDVLLLFAYNTNVLWILPTLLKLYLDFIKWDHCWTGDVRLMSHRLRNPLRLMARLVRLLLVIPCMVSSMLGTKSTWLKSLVWTASRLFVPLSNILLRVPSLCRCMVRMRMLLMIRL